MSISKLILGIASNVTIFSMSLFLPAGTLDWWRAWVFLGVVLVAAVASTAALYRSDMALLEERFKPPVQKGQPLADKVLVLLLLATFIGLIVFIPLDLFRFHLLARPGTVVSSTGLVLFAAGWWILTLAMLDNPFAVSVVRLQERKQRVIDSGVYGVVRHPMNKGAALNTEQCRKGDSMEQNKIKFTERFKKHLPLCLHITRILLATVALSFVKSK